ncbi:MAG: DUF1330 domain-containing protein [Geminicoccaceae bacterium]|nr:MAG: DUF1330 domain-containing protein [Geminicoccaceae bacterium]
MPAYVIALVTVDDPVAYERYRAEVPALVEAFGGRFLVRGGAQEVLEGTWPETRTVVMVFQDRAAATAFYRSDAYQAIVPLRQAASSGRMLVVDGVETV